MAKKTRDGEGEGEGNEGGTMLSRGGRGLTPGCFAGIVAVVLLALLVVPALTGFRSVQSYEGCLLVRNGKVTEEWEPGLHWRYPIMSNVTCYRTARTTYEALPGGEGSDAHYVDEAVDSRSSDGQRIDSISYRVAFHVPLTLTDDDGTVLVENNLETVYTQVGARTESAIVSSVITFYTRPSVRSMFQLYTADEILGGRLEEIETLIEEQIRPEFRKRGVELEDIELGRPDFNDEFEAKIQAEQNARQDTEIARQNVERSRQEGLARQEQARGEANASIETAIGEAQADIERARGESEAQIELARGESEATTITAAAQADATSQLVEAHGGPEFYVQARMAEAMANWRVQNLFGDGVVPFYSLDDSLDDVEGPTEE